MQSIPRQWYSPYFLFFIFKKYIVNTTLWQSVSRNVAVPSQYWEQAPLFHLVETFAMVGSNRVTVGGKWQKLVMFDVGGKWQKLVMFDVGGKWQKLVMMAIIAPSGSWEMMHVIHGGTSFLQ
jgi:hypothetical protein